jgi:hypothetical protein
MQVPSPSQGSWQVPIAIADANDKQWRREREKTNSENDQERK